MPTRRFDGPTLELALARARADVGPGARVISAERVRSGGIGGFFARERVEIEVDLGDAAIDPDDDPSPPAASARRPAADERPAAPATLLDLVDMVSEAERAGARRDAPAEQPVWVGAAPLPTRPQATPISTETSSFAEVLQRIAAEAEADTAPAAAPATARATAPPPAPASPQPPAPSASPSPASSPETVTRFIPEPIARPAAAAPHPTPAPTPLPTPAPQPALAGRAPALARLGLPADLVPVTGDLRTSLIERLAALPAPVPLPSTRGTVVAIVGPRAEAQQVAASLCETLGADPDTITTVTRRKRKGGTELTTTAEAADQRRAWRRRARPTVAVVEATVGKPATWAGEMLDALEPSAVWGLVDAHRKIEDIAAWSDDLGGLDGLCVNGTEETVTPAAVLTTGVPVVMVDGAPATPARWADLLLARIAS